MKKKIKKSNIFWLGKDRHDCDCIELYREEPTEKCDGDWLDDELYTLCAGNFVDLFPLGMRKGQKKKVKITIEVIE